MSFFFITHIVHQHTLTQHMHTPLQVVAEFMAEADEEDAYIESTDIDMKRSTDSMMSHPFVQSAYGAVVLLMGSGPRTPEIDAFVKYLTDHKIRVFESGDVPPQFGEFMPVALEVCSSVLVVCTEDIHSKKCQALTYLRHATKVNKDIVLAKLDPAMDLGGGQFGLLVQEFVVYDVTPDAGKGDLKKLVAHTAKLQKSSSKTLKKGATLVAPAMPDRLPSNKKSLTATHMALKMAGKSFDFRDDLAESIVLLYSWGRQSPDGSYKNQTKVLELKNELRANGFKVGRTVCSPR
jgi:hypothetical protein